MLAANHDDMTSSPGDAPPTSVSAAVADAPDASPTVPVAATAAPAAPAVVDSADTSADAAVEPAPDAGPAKDDEEAAPVAKPQQSIIDKMKSELPENFEEIIVKKIARIPEPKRADLEATLAPLRTVIDEAIAKKGTGRQMQQRRHQIRERTKPEYNAARKEYDIARQAFADKVELKRPIQASVAELRAVENEGRAASNRAGAPPGHPALKGIKSVEELEQRIQDLEFKHTSQSVSIQEEKKIIAELSYLKHKGRDTMADADRKRREERDGRDSRRKRRDELEVEVRAIDQEITQLKVVREQKRAAWEKIKDAQDKEIAALDADVGEINHDDLDKTIDETKAIMKEKENDFYAKVRESKENERQVKQQDYIRRKVKKIKEMEDYEIRKAEYAAEMAQYPPPDPYEAQKAMCDSLISYLSELKGVAESSTQPSSKVGSGLSDAVKEGGKAIGKSVKSADDTSEMDTGMYQGFGKAGKKGKGKGKRQKAEAGGADKKSANSKLPAQSHAKFEAFHSMGISPPTTYGEIPAVIEKIKEKKEYFNSAPPPKETKPARKEEKTQSKPESKKKTEYVHEEGPALGANGSVAPGPSSHMKFADALKAGKSLEQGPIIDATAPDEEYVET